MSKFTPAVAYSGAAVSAALAVLAIVDQTSAHWTRRDVASHYGSHGLDPDPNLLTILLTVSFLCAALLFALGVRAQSRGKKGAARGLAITITVCGLAFATLATFSSEYGGPVLVMFWRVLPWVVPMIAVADLMTIKSSTRPAA